MQLISQTVEKLEKNRNVEKACKNWHHVLHSAIIAATCLVAQHVACCAVQCQRSFTV